MLATGVDPWVPLLVPVATNANNYDYLNVTRSQIYTKKISMQSILASANTYT